MRQNEPSTTPLYFSLYAINDLHHPLILSSNTYAQIDMELGANQSDTEHDILLIGRINPGQTNVSAGDYYDYDTGVNIHYTSAPSMQSLPSCSGITENKIKDQISATATVKNDCEIISVDDMKFGNETPAEENMLQASSTANISIQCPTGTTYSVGIGHGLHSDGNVRSLCNHGECVQYGLYKYAEHSIE